MNMAYDLSYISQVYATNGSRDIQGTLVSGHFLSKRAKGKKKHECTLSKAFFNLWNIKLKSDNNNIWWCRFTILKKMSGKYKYRNISEYLFPNSFVAWYSLNNSGKCK